MKIPIKIWIALAIIITGGMGTCLAMFGILSTGGSDEKATRIAGGAALLFMSVALFVAYLAGAFQDIREE
jgi:hypothetical protein